MLESTNVHMKERSRIRQEICDFDERRQFERNLFRLLILCYKSIVCLRTPVSDSCRIAVVAFQPRTPLQELAMCGRYYIDQEDTLSEMRQIIDAVNQRYRDSIALETMKLGEIAPGHVVPAIRLRQTASGPAPVPELVRWGFQKRQSRSLLINARGETVTEKVTFRKAFQSMRILIPAHAFFEWENVQETGKKRKMRFFSSADPVIYMAGIARSEEEPNPDDPAASVLRFVIITTEANGSVSPVHDRMPLIVPRHFLRPYLADEQVARKLLASPVQTALAMKADD